MTEEENDAEEDGQGDEDQENDAQQEEIVVHMQPSCISHATFMYLSCNSHVSLM